MGEIDHIKESDNEQVISRSEGEQSQTTSPISLTRKKYRIALIRCCQPLLIGEETGELHSPNRSNTPEPTLPQLTGIIQEFAERTGATLEVSQIDLRDPRFGEIRDVEYGELELPYVDETLIKTYS